MNEQAVLELQKDIQLAQLDISKALACLAAGDPLETLFCVEDALSNLQMAAGTLRIWKDNP